jgi:hypothetical protein
MHRLRGAAASAGLSAQALLLDMQLPPLTACSMNHHAEAIHFR